MARDHKTYYALRPFPHKGRVHQPGEPIEMHPKQAKYLLGTHLAVRGEERGPGDSRGATAGVRPESRDNDAKDSSGNGSRTEATSTKPAPRRETSADKPAKSTKTQGDQ